MDNKTEDERLEKESTNKRQKRQFKNKKVTSDNHTIKKRAPFRFPKGKKDVYVNNKTSFKAYLEKCEKILDSNEKEVIIHGLGNAVNKANKLALRLKEIHHDTLELDIKTLSVTLTDDLEPINDDADYKVIERVSPSIHIRVFPTALIGALRFKN